jgi:hypothetical protein
MAYHEERLLFPVTRVPGADEERWFQGVHGTIGASDFTYNWMAAKAAQCGVPMRALTGLNLAQEQDWDDNGIGSRDTLPGDIYQSYPGVVFP